MSAIRQFRAWMDARRAATGRYPTVAKLSKCQREAIRSELGIVMRNQTPFDIVGSKLYDVLILAREPPDQG